MTEAKSNQARVAGGAGLAFVGRLGAMIEVVSVIAFTWLYGASTFGLFAVLWSYVKVSTAIADMAMTTALQRFIPRPDVDRDAIAGYAIKISFIIATLMTIISFALAPQIATVISASEADADKLVTVIRIYVWVLPFWTMVEVATAAVRANRTFGPEIKIRIFYEQGLRLVAAAIFAAFGLMTYGLFLAHLVSVVLAAGLALRLVAKYYHLPAVLAAPLTGKLPRDMRQYGLSIMPANIIKKLFSEFPVMFLNYMLPGAAGAAAGGYYSVARKIASALQAVRMTFEYVMAPLAAEKDGHGDRAALNAMYGYATRLSVMIALPFGAALILARHDILAAMAPEFEAATVAIAVLCAGRVFEAATGPSSSIIEMLGHRLLPPLNGLIGLAVMLGLGVYLIPSYGVTGASIAAACGLCTTALLGFFQTAHMFKLFPYGRDMLRPLLLSALLSLLMLGLVPFSNGWNAPIGILAATVGLALSLALIVRYGLASEDITALGKVGRFLKPKNGV